MYVFIGGIPASGKSYLTKRVAEKEMLKLLGL